MRVALVPLFAVSLIALTLIATAKATPQPDPLAGVLGQPTKFGGNTYYRKTRGGVHFVCRIWVFGTSRNVNGYVEQCIKSSMSRKQPKQTGPAS